MFLKIPGYSFAGYDFAQFCDHVIDHSPVFVTRTLLRLGFEARKSIADAKDGVAELGKESAELFARAAAEAPVPRLSIGDPNRPALNEPVPARAYEPFYQAIENMTEGRPEALPVEEPAMAAE